MKVSFERKFFLGYIINIVVIISLGLIYWKQMTVSSSTLWHWVLLALIVLSLGMLTTVFFMLKAQLKTKKQLDDALLKNQKLLQAIIDNTTNAISVKKINGEYLLVNKKYQSLFASKETNLIGKINHDFLSKDMADLYRNSDLDALKAGKEIQVEETIQLPEGTHTYLSVKFPLFDANKRAYAIGNISTDITERKVFLDSLKAADTFFNLSIDSLVVASKNKFLKINPPLSKLLGYSNHKLLTEAFTKFIHPDEFISCY